MKRNHQGDQKVTTKANETMSASTESFHDVTLFVGDRSIEAHQEVLRNASRYFAKAFDRYKSKGKKLVLSMTDVKVNYIELLDVIKYIYTGEFSADRKDTSKLLATFDLKFHFNVKTSAGKTIVMGDMHPSNTVTIVKNKFYEKERIPACEQRLIYCGRQLEDGKTLADYKVDKNSTIQLVLRLGGRPCTTCLAHANSSNNM